MLIYCTKLNLKVFKNPVKQLYLNMSDDMPRLNGINQSTSETKLQWIYKKSCKKEV